LHKEHTRTAEEELTDRLAFESSRQAMFDELERRRVRPLIGYTNNGGKSRYVPHYGAKERGRWEGRTLS
jgi:hypothetical protein